MEGIINFRELGGLKNREGKRIKPKTLLRGGALFFATQQDAKELKEIYNLLTIVDFRTLDEREKRPDFGGPFPLTDVNYVFAPVREKLTDFVAGDLKDKDDPYPLKVATTIMRGQLNIDATLTKSYEGFLLSDIGRNGYRSFFNALLGLPKGFSLYFHCSAGKDRTGIAAYLLMTALDFSEEEKRKEYLRTKEGCLQRQEEAERILREHNVQDEDAIRQVKDSIGVNIRWLDSALNKVQETYGSIEDYLYRGLNLTKEEVQTLKNKFLE